jgi:hypothetical protein
MINRGSTNSRIADSDNNLLKEVTIWLNVQKRQHPRMRNLQPRSQDAQNQPNPALQRKRHKLKQGPPAWHHPSAGGEISLFMDYQRLFP